MTPHHRTTGSLEDAAPHVPGELSRPHFSLGPGNTPVDAMQQTATVVNAALPHPLAELPGTAQSDADALTVLTESACVAAGRAAG